MIEIEIIDTGKRLPLSKKERLRMTFQAADFGEAGSGSGSFSTTCNVPITPKVIEALGFSIVPNATALLSAYKNIKARILQDENEIDKGFIRIDEDNATKKELKITFYGRNVDWFTALGDKTLKDLDLSEYDHIRSASTINEVRSEGYVYLPIDYGSLKTASSASISENDIWPAVFIDMLIKKIFKELGFKVAGTLFDKPEIKRLIIPYSLEEENVTFKKQDDLTVVVSRKSYPNQTGAILKNLPAFNANAEIKLELDETNGFKVSRDVFGLQSLKDLQGSWNKTTFVYTSPAYMDVDIDINLKGLFIESNVNSEFDIDVIIKKNGTTVFTKAIKWLTISNWDNVYEVLERYTYKTSLSLNLNDTLEFYIKIKTAYDFGYYSYNDGVRYIASPYIKIRPKLAIIYNSNISLNSFLPNMKQSELIEYLFFAYGIIPSFDKATNTVMLDSLTDLTVDGAENWTGKLDANQSVEHFYFDFVEDYAKKNNCIYAELEEDTETNTYKNNYLENYGTGNININNDFLEAESNYFEAPFFATKSREVFTGISTLVFYLPYIFRKDDDKGRILLFAGHRSVSELSNSVISSITIAGTSRSTIPYSYFIPPVGVVINDPINLLHLGFDDPKDNFEGSLSILQRTYYNLQKVLNKPISITCSLRLSAYDISRLKFNRLKYIQELGGYFYLNKVNQYDGSGEATECELIKWY